MPSTIESTAMFNSLKTKSTKAHATAGRFKPVTQSNSHNVTYSDKSYGNCASCGKRHSRFTCRLRYALCHKCGKTGHIQPVCRSTKTCRLIQARDSEVSNMAKHFSSLSLAITSHSGHIRKRLFSSTGNSLHFILDTGSVESLISVHDLKLFAPDAKLQPSTVTINGITGHSLPVVGSYTEQPDSTDEQNIEQQAATEELRVNEQVPRRAERLSAKPRLNYRNPVVSSRCGECDV
ncbi:unnamed protein product [Echinostoma caproni]|uniref:CCHC-type domain-containing protein n=1 Tax=Echinostoma caproni TaxID=27848 RepID=A0A183AT56_9TREM|nr:unnamed protein product [Echinostoma caproni]